MCMGGDWIFIVAKKKAYFKKFSHVLGHSSTYKSITMSPLDVSIIAAMLVLNHLHLGQHGCVHEP